MSMSVLVGPQVALAPSSTRSTWPPAMVSRFWPPPGAMARLAPAATEVVALPVSVPP